MYVYKFHVACFVYQKYLERYSVHKYFQSYVCENLGLYTSTMYGPNPNIKYSKRMMQFSSIFNDTFWAKVR